VSDDRDERALRRWLRALALCALTLCVLVLSAPRAGAADYPSKPVRVIVPFPPGGFNDTLGRTLSQKLQERCRQPVVVDNRPGAGSVLGTDLAAKAPADGLTLLIVSFAFAVNPSLHARLPYDTSRDFAPVVLAGAATNFLVANPALPAKTVAQLIALAKANPGRLNYGSGGNGTSTHLGMELFKLMAGVDLVHVPYKGSAPAITDLIGGQVDAMFDNAPNVLPHIKAGKLRALAVSTAQRSTLAPDVPTVAESGVPGYEVETWYGVVVRAGTPSAVIVALNAEINRVLALPEVQSRFTEQGVHAIGGSPERFAGHLRGQMSKWAKVVKDAGVRVD
jgi:tripartite-type tricarboxylate transporter receptor subunit TctC